MHFGAAGGAGAGPATTYCNIYAHDYCHLAGAYLPRVWWMLTALAAGQPLAPRYEATVRELNANALYEWLLDYGAAFSWQRLPEAADLQAATNAGWAALIVTQRTDLNQPGHIVAVVPETADWQATRRAGLVRVPLQSQAGSRNSAYLSSSATWWTATRFRRFAFWAQGPALAPAV